MDGQDSGSLGQKAFLTLLVELHQGDATGSLKLERAPLQKAVYFRDGQILFAASNDPQDQLASILVEEGKLSKDQMQVAQARVTAGNPLAKVLTELGYISQRELADAARLKVEKILTDLYLWNEGSYQFVERSLPKGAIDLELSTPRLLFNSIRRVQEREWVLAQLGSLDAVLSSVPEALDNFLTATKPEPSAGEVLRLVDGVKSIKQIGAISALDEFEVCKILAAAIQIGAIERASEPGAADAAPPPLDPETPAAPEAPAPAPDVGLPFSEDAVAETTVLKIGEGGIQPPAAEGLPQSPVPLDEAEKIVPPENRPAADFVFDETPITTPSEERRMPRPRNMRRGGVGGSGNKKVLVALLALILLGGGGAAYYFLWPQSSSEGANGNSGTSGSGASGTLDSPSDTTASIGPDTNDTTDTSETPSDGEETGTTEPPPSTTAPPTTAPPTTGPTPTSPSDTPSVRPSTTVSPSRPTGRPMAQGAQQLRSGNYPQASATFLSHLRSVGADSFTIAVGVFCDTSNVDRVVRNSGGTEELIVLAFNNQGRSCYRVFWGIFGTRLEAERAVGTVPAGVLARDSAPVPIDRLLP